VTDEQHFHVAWNVDGTELHHDVTLVLHAGRVVQRLPGRAPGAIDLGNVAWIPGLVNAHTHLEFSRLAAPIPTQGRFPDWIRRVVEYRRMHPDQTPDALQRGLDESRQAGTTLIGEIATTGWSPANYIDNGFQGIVFQEILGFAAERREAQYRLLENLLESSSGSLTYGISPHAPYSVHPELFDRVLELARTRRTVVAMHLAETRDELELLERGTGTFRELLEDFGIWQNGLFGGRRPLELLESLATCERALVIHGNYLTDEELEFVAAQPAMTLVYCPRTHAAFGHSAHPWLRLKELGGRVALGTDSRASNPDLSLFAELQFLAQQHPGVPHRQLLALGTSAGREALLGSTSPDHSACLVQLAGTGPLDETLLAAGSRVIGTLCDGAWQRTPPTSTPSGATPISPGNPGKAFGSEAQPQP